MRVNVHPADRHAVGHHRLIWPAQQADPLDVSVHVHDGRPIDHYEAAYGQGGTPLWLVGNLPDVVVLQRPLRWSEVTLIELLQAAGVAVVVEVDDHYEAIDERNIAHLDAQPHWWSEEEWDLLLERRPGAVAAEVRFDPRTERRFFRFDGEESRVSWRWLARACELADLVTVSTPLLASVYGAHGRVRVLPNMVPASYFDVVGKRNAVPTVGCTQTLLTHLGDAVVVGNGLAEAMRQVPSRFRTVGMSGRTAEVLGVPRRAREHRGFKPLLGGYPQTVAGFDVALAPLAATAFNEAKSWLRPLEASALGVAWVGSPTSEYRALHERGAGVLAATPAAWEVHLVRLLEDEQARAEQVEANRAAVADLTYQRQGWRWIEAWADALAHRRAQTRSAA